MGQRSLSELNALVEAELDRITEWQLEMVYATDRVAFDERPPELQDLPLRRKQAEVHRVTIEPW